MFLLNLLFVYLINTIHKFKLIIVFLFILYYIFDKLMAGKKNQVMFEENEISKNCVYSL